MEDFFEEENGVHRPEPRLDVTSRAFQPKRFIQRVLASVPHSTFESQLVDQVGQAEEGTGEALKQLIRDNLAVFVNSKDAMDAVFHADHELFTGEALDGITDAFRGATDSCDALVEPITANFVEVQKSRRSQDMLDKLFSVLGVPGAVYECCGTKVAVRRQSTLGDSSASSASEDHEDGEQDEKEESSEQRSEDGGSTKENSVRPRGGTSNAAAAQRRRSSPLYDDGDSDEEEEDSEDDALHGAGNASASAQAGADGGLNALPSKAHGTLENPGGATDPAELFVIDSGEEVYLWYGTPLVRLRDVDERRHHTETVSNYEAAVLHLRRAMLYLEETYSMETGGLLAGEDGMPSDAPPPASLARSSQQLVGNASGTSRPNSPSTSAQQTTTTPPASTPAIRAGIRSAFAYKLSMALLRAALYLCSQLAEELVYANAADTVLIEDTLSIMMDASIGTVKLRHFCAVLQKTACQGSEMRKSSLTKLRKHLDGSGSTAGDGNPLPSSPSPPSPSSNNNNGSGGPTTRRRSVVQQHPVQYFISIVQKQHRHLIATSAAALLREAHAWMWKVQADAARGMEERQRQRDLQRRLRAAAAGGVDIGEDTSLLNATATMSGGLLTNSFLGASVAADGGGFIGNANDSFLQDPTLSWARGRDGPGSPTQPPPSGSPLRGAGASQGLGGSGTQNGGGATTTMAGSGNGGTEAQKFVRLIPDAFVTRMLEAFNTPESPFPPITELKVGTTDMDAVLVSSCLQVRMHAASLLNQLFTRADVESAVMAQAGTLNSFALRLCTECVGTLEHVVGSYWGGIATTLHAGVFDFTPDEKLAAMLAELRIDTATGDGGGGRGGDANTQAAGTAEDRRRSSDHNDGNALQMDAVRSRTASAMLSTMHSRTSSMASPNASMQLDVRPTAGGGAPRPGSAPSKTTVSGGGSSSADQLPQLRFIPVLSPSLHGTGTTASGGAASSDKNANTPSSDAAGGPTCLRDFSTQAVRQMIHTASTTLQSLFIAFMHKGVVDGFVGTLARYRSSDVVRHSRTEQLELHAAVLYEVLLGQWERMMQLVCDSVLRLKIVMGESSSSSTITSDKQVEEVGDLLQELEGLRSSCLRCYLHGIGVLSKAYLTMMPLLQRRAESALDARIRARLTRDSVSSSEVHKLLNVLSVVVDRCAVFFARDTEVFDSVDLFAVKAESLADAAAEEEEERNGRNGGGAGGAAGGRRFRLMRRRYGTGAGGVAVAPSSNGGSSRPGARQPPTDPAAAAINTATDPISELLAHYHSKVVVESLQDHEELVLALLSHLLLSFVDTLQLKCRGATAEDAVSHEEKERSVVESVADALCLATTVSPIMVEHLLSPCFLELLARQLPDVARAPAELAAYLAQKQQQYAQAYLGVVEEHCQLAVDAMMRTYLALAQQPITDLVRRQGFVQPLFDWQRVSPHITTAVRPYIADSIACIARAREALNAIHQPILGSAATQRLVAHFVRTFLTAFTTDINVFELSVECSPNFLVLGLTLLEAESRTILTVAESVIAHTQRNPNAGELAAELLIAKESLAAFIQSLEVYTTAVAEGIAASRGQDGASELAVAQSLLSREKRQQRRDGMVQSAVRTLDYMLQAITTELIESSLSSSSFLQLKSSATENIVQRLAQRSAGNELRRTKAVEKERDRREAAVATAAKHRRLNDAADADATKTSRRRPGNITLPSAGATGTGEDASGAVLTPRTVQAHDAAASSAIAAAGDVFHIAQAQQGPKAHKKKVRRVRRAEDSTTPPVPAADNKAAGDDGGRVKAGAASPPVSRIPPSALSAPAVRPSPPPAPAAPVSEEEEEEAEERRPRPVRRARRGVAAAEGGQPRERRTNRFRRSNAV